VVSGQRGQANNRISELDVVLDHVQHNQSATLRPSEKMLRLVCLNCHGLGFANEALADADLVRRNFAGPSSVRIPSIRMAVERDEAIRIQRLQQEAASQGAVE
jgi:hypothetical protein